MHPGGHAVRVEEGPIHEDGQRRPECLNLRDHHLDQGPPAPFAGRRQGAMDLLVRRGARSH